MDKNNIRPRNLNGASSFLLDCLRLGSALTVLFVHTYLQWFPGEFYSSYMVGNIAHSAVIIFFVLSGYVIAHTIAINNRGKLKYAQARLSRLYSVLFPSLILTIIIQCVIQRVNPTLYAEYTRGASFPRYILSGTFLNEIWFLSAAPPLNEPLWSLSFEFWYYVIFGFWFYKSYGWRSFMLPLLACIIAGPKILLMMPIWILGCLGYSLHEPNIKRSFAWVLFFLGFATAMLIVGLVPPYPGVAGRAPLFFANQFITDFFIGIFFAFSVWVLPSGTDTYIQPKWVKIFRRIADLTYPIYVLNQPFLILYRTVFKFQTNNIHQFFEALIVVLLLAGSIGILFDHFRRKWSQLFNWLLIGIRKILKSNMHIVNH